MEFLIPLAYSLPVIFFMIKKICQTQWTRPVRSVPLQVQGGDPQTQDGARGREWEWPLGGVGSKRGRGKLELEGGEGCTPLWIPKKPPSCVLKAVET